MRIKQVSLNSKILAFVTLILILVTALVSITTLQSAYNHSNSQLSESFSTSRQVFLYKLQNDGDVLLGALQNAAKDFNTKQLIASGMEDPDSLRAALVNQQRRSSADFTVVYDSQRKTVLSTSGQPLSLEVEKYTNSGVTLFAKGKKVYLLKAAPVKYLEQQPTVDAWLLMGIDLNRLINRELALLTGFDVHLFHNKEYVTGAFVNGNHQTAIEVTPENLPLNETMGLKIGGIELIGYRFVANKDQPQLSFIFLIESSSAFLNFSKLTVQLVAELLLAILVAFLLSIYLSKNITKPLRTLASAADRIRQGDYQSPIPKVETLEVKQLSMAFEGMQDSIQAREKEINQLAYFDSLTALPNRNSFIKKLAEKIRQNPDQPLAVLMLDLDRFKEVNDTVGHKFGDKLLQHIARRIDSIHSTDAFHARVGGDEFSILISGVSHADLTAAVKQYSTLFESPFDIDGIYLDIDTSIGVASYPEHGSDAGEIIQRADIALYKCKESHKPYTFYQEDFDTYSLQRLSLMSELRLAIEDNQLQLFYQPKLCLKTNKIISVECLVRWIHPEHGFINPDDFIPLAEQSGAIRDLTHWVINTALRQHVEWRKANIDLRFAVNISALDLVDLSLPAYVAEQLRSFNAEADALTLEVTESALMADPDAAIKALDMLRRMGIKLSIDDFGTGYSSMAYLKDMPVSELKIDKAFVLDLTNNTSDQNIVKSTVYLAHNMGLSVVAEGVEDGAALKLLSSYKVEIAQGYFIAKPMPSTDFETWLINSPYWDGRDNNNDNKI